MHITRIQQSKQICIVWRRTFYTPNTQVHEYMHAGGLKYTHKHTRESVPQVTGGFKRVQESEFAIFRHSLSAVCLKFRVPVGR